MEPEDRKAFIAEYLAAQTEAKELLAYKNRFEAFCGFIEQAECVRVVKSRERPSEKVAKYFLIVKNTTQPVLVVKLPIFDTPPESGDALFWTQLKGLTDEVVLLGIKKPDGTVKTLRDKFKNADGKSCPTMFFVSPDRNILVVRSKLNDFQKYIDTNRDGFNAALVAQKLAVIAKADGRQSKKSPTSSI